VKAMLGEKIARDLAKSLEAPYLLISLSPRLPGISPSP
jgi:hypothetical protein